jgi:hypothetical protein
VTRLHIVFAVLVATVSIPVAALAAPRLSYEEEARGVTVAFFRSINERRYDRACRLLSKAYYKKYRIPSRRHCVAGLRIGFMWSQEIRFRITDIEADRERAIVSALADGAPGRVVLIRERGRFKVLELQGA